MKFTILSLALLCCLAVSAQEYVVVNSRSGPLYLGIENPLNIFVESCSCASLSASTDNGTLKKYGCDFIYRPARSGDALITVFKTQNGKRVKIGSRHIYAVPFPKPVAAIGPYANGSAIPKNAFCAQAGVYAFTGGNLGIDVDYRVTGFSVIIMRDSTIRFSSVQAGNTFDEKLHNAFLAMEPGSIVLIADIWVIGPDLKPMKIDPLEYVIQ